MPTRAGGGGRVTKRQKQSAVSAVGNIFGGAAKKTGKKAAVVKPAVATSIPKPPRAIPPALQTHVQMPSVQQRKQTLVSSIIHSTTTNPPALHDQAFEDTPNVTVKDLLGGTVYRSALQARHQLIASQENLKQPADLTNAILLATPVGWERLAAKEAIRAGAEQATGQAEKSVAARLAARRSSTSVSQAEERATARAAGEKVSTVEKGSIRGAERRQLAREARAKRVSGASRSRNPLVHRPTGLRQGAYGVGKVGSKIALAPLKHPVLAFGGGPVAAETPGVIRTGNLGRFRQALEGQGTAAHLLQSAGRTVSSAVPTQVGKNLVNDAFELPAQVLPSVYLPLAGAVEASHGNDSRLKSLLNQYKRTGLLPAIFKGDVNQALHALKTHPLYSALEVSGAKALVGRTAGAVLRQGPLKHPLVPAARRLAHTGGREDLVVHGDVRQTRRYSPDVINKAFQVAADKRARRKGGGKIVPTPRQVKRIMGTHIDYKTYALEQARRQGRAEETNAMRDAMPRTKRGPLRRAKREPSPQAEVASLSAQRIARTPETFHADLRSYGDQLDHSYQQMSLERDQVLKAFDSGKIDRHQLRQQKIALKGELEANRLLKEHIDAALKSDNPDLAQKTIDAARVFIERHGKITQGLVEHGLLDANQAAKAAAIPYARRFMGAGHGISNENAARIQELDAQLPNPGQPMTHEQRGLAGERSSLRARKQVLDRQGNPLTLEQIHAHMKRSGVEPPGFLTHRPGAERPSDFFRSFKSRQQLPKGARTGAAVERGTFGGGWDSLVRQLVRSRSVLDAVKGFDSITRHMSLKHGDGKLVSFRNFAEAERGLSDPQAHGFALPTALPNEADWVPWRLSPMGAKRLEAEVARQHSELLDPRGAEPTTVLHEAIQAAKSPHGEGAVVLVPKAMRDRLEGHFAMLSKGEKGLQSVTGAFKGVVLPTSPKWLAGNYFDVGIRSMLSGILPPPLSRFQPSALLGSRLHAEMDPYAQEMTVSGSHFSQVGQQEVHREAQQFAGSKLQPMYRAWGTAIRTPGIKGLHDLWTTYKNAVFHFDSKFIEQMPQYAELGREGRRELQATTGQWHSALNVGDAALQDLAKGLHSTSKQIQYAKAIEEVFGNWGKNSPEARRFLTNLAPFWMWARASARFVLVTMPLHHPVTTALIAASEEMTQKERERLGFSLLPRRQLPGFLQGGIPGGGGSIIPLSQLTSFGVFADYPQFIQGLPFPYVSNALSALAGIDWKGEKLVDGQGRPLNEQQRALYALSIQGESFLPFFTLHRTIQAHGLLGALNPLRKESASTVRFLKGLSTSKQITVPAVPKGGGGGVSDYSQYFSGSSGSSGGTTDYSQYFNSK